MDNDELIGKDAKFKGKIDRIIFSKKQYNGNYFAIFRFNISEFMEGEVPTEVRFSKTATCIGEMFSIKTTEEFKIVGELVKNEKYGYQYQIKNVNTCFDLSKKEDQEKFFRTVLTESACNLLMKSFDDPVSVLESGKIEELIKIKGIKTKTANSLIRKYKNNLDCGEAYVKLYYFGLSKQQIDKIVKQFNSPSEAVEKITTDPYIVMRKVRGYGWTKCDKIACNSGIGENDERRIRSFVEYFLNKEAEENGNTWILKDKLIDEIYAEAPNLDPSDCSLFLKHMIEEGILWKDDERVALKRMYNLEKRVADEIFRIKDGPFTPIENIEKAIQEAQIQVGYEYTEEQVNAIRKIADNKVCILNGIAGCVDKDTEFFDGKKWKKISEYQKGDKVLQYFSDGTTSLVEPMRYIKDPCETLCHIESRYGINLTASLDHEMPYVTSDGKLEKKTVEEIKVLQEANSCGFSGNFITAFDYEGPGISLSDGEIRFTIAVIFGGIYNTEDPNPTKCRFRAIREERKREIEEILREANVPFESKSSPDGYGNYYFNIPKIETEFSEEWYNCNGHQLDVCCKEISLWCQCPKGEDDTGGTKRFYTNSDNITDFIQFAFSSRGYNVKVYNRIIGRKNFRPFEKYTKKDFKYEIYVVKDKFISIGNSNNSIRNDTPMFVPVVPEDGYQYCFSVPSSMWVMRRGKRILISGNCGKSSIMLPIVRAAQEQGLRIEQCCLAGKAALNLSEITGVEGKTIHRLLGYLPDGRFIHTEKDPLEVDLLIIDEISMIGADLFCDLFKAVPNSCQIVLIGDPGQLESIGVANVAKNMRDSGAIPLVSLHFVHRQALKSGILSDSTKTYNSQQFISNSLTGREIHGELQDFEIIAQEDGRFCAIAVLEKYKELFFEKKIPIRDICVITTKRATGETSARVLNDYIQNIVNPESLNKDNMTVPYEDEGLKYTINYRVDDKVLCTKNTYRMHAINNNEDGEDVPKEVNIFNGNIGVIKWVDADNFIMGIEFPSGFVAFEGENLKNLQLGYAITCHRAQGSTIPYVIAVCSNESYVLNSKEMLYTQITRAKKYCCLIGEVRAIRSSVTTSKVKTKQTFLTEMLIDKIIQEGDQDEQD